MFVIVRNEITSKIAANPVSGQGDHPAHDIDRRRGLSVRSEAAHFAFMSIRDESQQPRDPAVEVSEAVGGGFSMKDLRPTTQKGRDRQRLKVTSAVTGYYQGIFERRRAKSTIGMAPM